MDFKVYAAPGNHGTLVYISDLALPIWEPRVVEGPGYLDLKLFPTAQKLARLFNGINVYKARLGRELELLDQFDTFHLAIVPTPDCKMSCTYCYARFARPSSEKIDLNFLRRVFEAGGKLISSVAVYGGDPIVYDGLAEFLRSCRPDINITFSSGLGVSTEEFDRKLREFQKFNIGLSLSIDPPPEPGKPYTRVYAPFKSSWYDELIRRAGLVFKSLKNFGVRATVTGACYDTSRLRSDLSKASGVGYKRLPMRAEPATGYTAAPGQLEKCYAQLAREKAEVESGLLDPEFSSFAKIFESISPDTVFARGGCYPFRNLSVAWNGTMSFCSRSGTWVHGRGVFDFSTPEEYREILRHVVLRSKCAGCVQEHTCGTHCHVAMEEQGHEFACAYHIRVAELGLQLVAKSPGVEQLNNLLDQRLTNMRRWEELATEDEFNARMALLQHQVSRIQRHAQALRLELAP